MKVRVLALNEWGHKNFVRATDGATGYDLVASEPRTVYPGTVVAVPTGVCLELPPTIDCQVRSRSGLARKGVAVFNAPGTIDPDYQGELEVLLFNAGASPYAVRPGDRIAQAVFALSAHPAFEPVATFETVTKRGRRGFGSTGA